MRGIIQVNISKDVSLRYILSSRKPTYLENVHYVSHEPFTSSHHYTHRKAMAHLLAYYFDHLLPRSRFNHQTRSRPLGHRPNTWPHPVESANLAELADWSVCLSDDVHFLRLTCACACTCTCTCTCACTCTCNMCTCACKTCGKEVVLSHATCTCACTCEEEEDQD